MRSELIYEQGAQSIFDIISAEYQNMKTARKNNKDTYLSGSISRYSKNLIMSFPTICDNTLPIDTVQMVSKAHEKNLATMFEMLFSAMSLQGNNGVEILKKIHQNLGGSGNGDNSIDWYIDQIEQLVGESNLSYTQKAAINQFIREAVADFKTPQKCFPVESLNEKSLADYNVKNLRGKLLVSENKPQVDPSIAAAKEEKEAEYAANRDRREEEKNEREKTKEERQKSKDELDLAQKMLPQVKDIDYKKANELQPTVLVINFTTLPDDNGKSQTKTFLAGVKSRVVGCDAIDIVDRLVEKTKAKLSFKDFIRATTGEIKFVRDFILRTKDMKNQAIADHARKGTSAKMWKLLEKRARANAKGKLYKSNDASAITTLVISKSTVDFLKASNKIDLLNVKTATTLMEGFNLLAIVICDEINESAMFLYDGNNEYDTYSYRVLSKEASDKSYKKVIDLINSAGR